jgi:hypothetical protein
MTGPLDDAQVANIRARLEAVGPCDIWPRRDIDREGTCDGCAEGRHLVAAYDDPEGKSEPWLCAECAAESDFLDNARTDIAALLADRAALAARLAEVEGEVERLRGEHLAFTRALGFGDGVTEPAATLAQMVDPIEQAFSEASEYHEGPRICEPCGEWLATETCEHCHGSGCGPGTASGAYSECEWCAGVGKIHPGCVEQSYADLVAERDEARAAVGRVEAYIEECECGHIQAALRAALRGEAGEGRA